MATAVILFFSSKNSVQLVQIMKLGLIGLGRMGGNMAMKLLEGGHEVVVWNRSPEKGEELLQEVKSHPSSTLRVKNVKVAASIKALVEGLEKPRVVWSMVSVGEATEGVLNEIGKYVEAGDIVIDGSNSFYKDTEKRYKLFTDKGIRYLGMGVAGGIKGLTEGYALMAGGDKSAYEYLIPLLDTLVKPHAGHEYYGPGGAGHFVKMIHNGIEYGYMQAIAEGFDVLEHSSYNLDLKQIAKQWAKNSLVSGFMMDRAVEALARDPHMEHLEGVIDATGEAGWTVETANELGVPVEIIEASLEYRKRSQTDPAIQASFTAKMVAALRLAFGGHGVKKK